MTVARPTRYPQVALTPGGNYAEPGSGVQLGGWATGAIYPSADANWLWRTITDWNRSHDASRLSSTDVLTSTVCRVSVAALDIDLGTGLTADITIGGVYYGNGERIDLTDAPTVYSGGSALVFPAGSTRYVCARPQPPTGGAANASSCAELIVSASNPPAGYVTILRVDTDATDIVAVTEPPSVVTYLEFAVAPDFTAGLVGTTAQLEDFITAPIASFAGAAGSPTVEATAFDGQSAIVATGTGAAVTIAVTHDGARAGINVAHTGSGDGLAVDVSGGSGKGVVITGNASTNAAEITAGAGQVGLLLTGAAGASYAMVLGASGGNCGGASIQGTGAGWGLLVNSGSTAGSYGIVAVAQNTTSNAIYASSANNGAPAILAEGNGSAAGLMATSAASYAIILAPDTSTPAYPAVYCDPQGANPSNVVDGTLTYNGTTKQWITGSATDSAYRGIHSSLSGYVYGANHSTPTTNASTAFYTTLCTVTLTAQNAPRVVGSKVNLRVSMRVGNSSGSALYCDVQVRATTYPATITTRAGSGLLITAGYPVAATTGDYTTHISFDVEHTITTAGAQSFVLEFKRNSGVGNLIAQGSLIVTSAS